MTITTDRLESLCERATTGKPVNVYLNNVSVPLKVVEHYVDAYGSVCLTVEESHGQL